MHTSPMETTPAPLQYHAGTSPAPHKAAFWDKTARRYASDPISDMVGYDRTLRRTRAWLRPEHHVLEIGCGTGTTALHLAPSVASYLATDVSAHMVAIAQAKLALYPRTGLHFEAVDADASYPMQPSTCDAVLAFNVLHLVSDLNACLDACTTVLVHGGHMISKTPCLKEMNPLIPKLAVPIGRLLGKAPAVTSLAVDDLCNAMQRHGLVVEAVERHAGKERDARPFIVARKP